MQKSKWDLWKERKYHNDEQLKIFIDYYNLLFNKLNITTQNKSAMEIGAGHGISTEIFVPLFKKFYAIEPNEIFYNELKKLKNKYKQLQTYNSSCEELKETNDKINFVIFTYSFFCTNKKKSISIISKILKKNGYILHPPTFKMR